MTLTCGKAAGSDEIPTDAIKANIETCCTISLARSGRRKRYRPSGKKESSSSCSKKEILGTAATIEGSCSCQRQARFPTGFYWRG